MSATCNDRKSTSFIRQFTDKERESLQKLHNEKLSLTDVPLTYRFLLLKCCKKIYISGNKRLVTLTNNDVIAWVQVKATNARYYSGSMSVTNQKIMHLQKCQSVRKTLAGKLLIFLEFGVIEW